MAYSKAYQEIIAGRVREDEQIGFFGHNEVALPPRVTSFTNMISNKEPVITQDFLASDEVGKPDGGDREPTLNTYIPNKCQIS
jgi:hypothetical protein